MNLNVLRFKGEILLTFEQVTCTRFEGLILGVH